MPFSTDALVSKKKRNAAKASIDEGLHICIYKYIDIDIDIDIDIYRYIDI